MLDNPRRLAARLRRSAFAFPALALAGLALLAISETAYQRATASLDALGTLGQARSSIQRLHRLMLDAETGQRGYLLTGNKDYLKPYREANEDLQATLKSLQAYFAPLPQAAAMARLEKAVQGKLSELQETLRRFDDHDEQGWRAVLEAGFGSEQMEQIRTLSEQLLADESAKVGAGRSDVYETLMLSRIGVGAMTAMSLLLLFMYLREAGVLEREREAQRAAVQAERDHLEVVVRRRTGQLAELARHLQSAREDERGRLARELHDELGALLTAAKLDAARLKSRLGPLGPEALERLNHLTDSLDSGIALKRRIIEDLRPSALASLGLVPALDILTREYAQRSGITVDASLEPVPLDPQAELTAYRIVQEALTNIGKHAKARRVEVVLAPQDGRARIAVSDDGVGFDTAASTPSSHGLVGMQYRVESAGGTLRIDSARGQGTRIEALLPGPAVTAA